MPNSESKINAILFDYETTNRTDFRNGEIKDLILTKYKAKPPCFKNRPAPLKDVHTLTDWKDVGIPFSLLHKPKDIVGTDPTKIQKPCMKTRDAGHDYAIKSRPRVVITPAVSMDDIEDPRARAILIDSMYTSDTTRGMREAVTTYFSVRAPLPDLPTHSNPMRLPKLQPPLVSPEWRMESVSWDNKQLRADCDRNKEFWKRRKLTKYSCLPCEESATVDALRKTRKMELQ